MYVTGGLGSTRIGEAFTVPFDLPNDTAYAETCAAIAMVFFANAMQQLDPRAVYADVIERALYNGVLSGLSLDGKAFFYENPLEINLLEHIENERGKRKLAITERVECFQCSCCPPNLNRLLASLGNYIYGREGDTLFVHQFVTSTLHAGEVFLEQITNYPTNGTVKLKARGVSALAVRIPSWCEKFDIDNPYRTENGYAVIDDTEATVTFDLTPTVVFPDPRVIRDSGRIAVMRGPVVYCAEAVDNQAPLHAIVLPQSPTFREEQSEAFGLCTLKTDCEYQLPFEEGTLYSHRAPALSKTTLTLIPYAAFANRGESNMTVFLRMK